jgi:hypothetical protein
MVQGWVAGTFANKGLIVTTDQGASHAAAETWREFETIRADDATLIPFMVVAWTIPAPADKTIIFTGGSLTLNADGTGSLTFSGWH